MTDFYMPYYELNPGTGNHPHKGCCNAPTICDRPGPEGKWLVDTWALTSSIGPDGPLFARMQTYAAIHDGVPQADGTRAFPIDECMLTIHEHPGDRCPSLPSTGRIQPSPQSVSPVSLISPTDRPNLILIKNEEAA